MHYLVKYLINILICDFVHDLIYDFIHDLIYDFIEIIDFKDILFKLFDYY